MLKFVKKLIIHSKTKEGLIREDEISSVSDKEATEFLEKMPIESLIDLEKIEKDEIFLRKDILNSNHGYIACLGLPGQGKSSLCNAFYKTLYGINKELFFVSNSTLSLTKGMWILKEREKQNIKQNIDKDIIDVEGFQVDDVSTWNYIMISAFISTDIIIVNRRERMDDVKKILSIIWNSLEKIKKLGLPKLLKAIWVQLDDEDKISAFQDIMNSIDNSSEKWNEIGIKLYPILIEEVDRKEYKKAKYNILECESYLEQVKSVFEQVLRLSISEPISTLLPYIDNFYNALYGKDTFNMDNIKVELKKDFETAYSTIKRKKENKLRQDYNLENFKAPKNSNETFDDFIQRHTQINFKFEVYDVIDKLSFYKSSEAFDKIYDEMINQKDFKADPYIFKPIYDTLIKKVRVKEEQMYLVYQTAKIKIEKYFLDLKFYDNIESFSPYKYNINGDYDNETKNNYNKKLKDYYYEKEKMKREEWENQIARSKYKCLVKCYGEMCCVNGHNLDDNVGCGSCGEKGIEFNKRLLYWVDGETHHAICHNCNKVKKINEKLTCYCGAESKSIVKFTDYKP